MFSVKSEVRDKVAGLKDGAIDYLTKPFSVDELVTRVSRILSAAADGASAVPSASPR
jgi:DNA-binding response OmpR family regulator